jgi:hypothetical protein
MDSPVTVMPGGHTTALQVVTHTRKVNGTEGNTAIRAGSADIPPPTAVTPVSRRIMEPRIATSINKIHRAQGAMLITEQSM